MIGRAERAWRFVRPTGDSGDEWAGIQAGPAGTIDLVIGPDLIRQAIWLLLSTVPGERVHRPEYGCALSRLVFAPNDDTTAGLAIHYVREAIERWEPRVIVLRIDAGPEPLVPERLAIVVDYRIRLTDHVDQVRLPLDLANGQPA